MRLEKLVLENFLTYDSLEYQFERRPLLVQGLNKTDQGQVSNGSGKSGLQTAIEFCITASNSRGVRDQELISYGYDKSRVELFASCDVRKERIHIQWIIKRKGANKLSLHIQKSGDWEEVSFSNINDGKKSIINWFAISKEDLFNYFIINKTRFKSFFESSNREKVDLINRFSDASIIEGLENIDIDELESQYSSLGTQISKEEGKKELIESQIESEKDRDFDSELKDKVSDINDLIEEEEEEISDIEDKIEGLIPRREELEQEIEEYQRDIQEQESIIEDARLKGEPYSDKLQELNVVVKQALKEVQKFIKTDFDTARADYQYDLESDQKTLSEANSQKDTLERQEGKLLKLLQDIEIKLSGAITCPKCNHEFLLDGDVVELKEKQTKALVIRGQVEQNKAANKAAISILKQQMQSLEDELSKVNKLEQAEIEAYGEVKQALDRAREDVSNQERLITGIQKTIDYAEGDIRGFESDIREVELEIKGLSQTRETFKQNITNHQDKIQNYRDQIKGLKLGNNKDIIRELETDLSAVEQRIVKLTKDYNRVGDQIYLSNQWKNNFKQFRMYLANQSLEVIQYHSNRYLKEMNCDLSIKLEGYKTLADGSIKDEITAKIIRGEERTFGSFSGGEKGRLLFSSILANRHMINSTHPYGGLDFLSVDEVFEGVDAMGLKYLINSAKNLDITAMIITHVTDEETSQDVLKIEKINGISKIKI
jgi:exonuclease SbcC